MLLDHILSLLAPHECVSCLSEGKLLCADCQAKLQPAIRCCYKCLAASPGFATCPDCRRLSPLGSIQAATRYSGAAKDVIWKLKFGRARAGGSEIAGIINSQLRLAKRIADWPAAMRRDVIIMHAPTANARVRQRGYDQAALIAQGLARQTGLPHRALLRRSGNQEQIGANKAQRAAQLHGVFAVVGGRQLRGKHIILVDDVVTTGATLEAAAHALIAAGARRVDAIVFAQA